MDEDLWRALSGLPSPCGTTVLIEPERTIEVAGQTLDLSDRYVGDKFVVTCNRPRGHDGPHECWFGSARWNRCGVGGSGT